MTNAVRKKKKKQERDKCVERWWCRFNEGSQKKPPYRWDGSRLEEARERAIIPNRGRE